MAHQTLLLFLTFNIYDIHKQVDKQDNPKTSL